VAAVAKAARFRLSQRVAAAVVGVMLRAGLALPVRLAPEDCPPGQQLRPVLPVRECPAPMQPRPRITLGKAAVVVVVLQIPRQASRAAVPCGAAVVVGLAGIVAQRLRSWWQRLAAEISLLSAAAAWQERAAQLQRRAVPARPPTAWQAVKAAVAVALRSRPRRTALRAERAVLAAAQAAAVARATTPARAALVASVATGTAS
jgi:hypothetical protein